MIPRLRKNNDSLPKTDMTFNGQPPIVVEAFPASGSRGRRPAKVFDLDFIRENLRPKQPARF